MSELYYLQNGYSGDLALFWKHGKSGYTTDLNKAHLFTKEEAYHQAYMRPDEDVPVRYSDARANAALTVSRQNLILPPADKEGK